MTTHRLDNVLQQGDPRYGCHGEPRPISGAAVIHGNNLTIIADTQWNDLHNRPTARYSPVPCHYQKDHDDPLCAGCCHKGTASQ